MRLTKRAGWLLWWIGFLSSILVPLVLVGIAMNSDAAARYAAAQQVSNQLTRQWGDISLDMASVDYNSDDGLTVKLRLAGCVVPAHFPKASFHPGSGKDLGGLYIYNNVGGQSRPIRVDVTPSQFRRELRAGGLWHCVAADYRIGPPVGG